MSGWFTVSYIGGGHTLLTPMSRSLQDSSLGKNSYKSVECSQRYDIMYQLALLWSQELLPNADEYLNSPHTISILKVTSYESKQNHQLWDITLKSY